MANLKGSTFEKQIRDANFRLAAFGVKKRGDHLTHSDGLNKERNKILNKFKDFLEREELKGKLNQLMTTNNINRFLNERFENLDIGTQKKDLSTLSSLIKGLEEVNINISINNRFFKEYREKIKSTQFAKEDSEDFSQKNRYIKNIDQHISNISDKQSKLYAQVLKSTGVRRDEAETVMKNIFTAKDVELDKKGIVEIDKMTFKFQNNIVIINGIFGKGGREYKVDKYIPLSTFNQIKNLNKINSSTTLNKKLGSRKAHDYRYTFSRNFYTKTKEAGYSEKEALAMTSQELGHNRISMTRYYLKRAKR